MASCPRRLSGTLARLAGPVALIAAFGAPADAQPACVAGPLAGYLTPGFQCQLAGWRFFSFSWDTQTQALPGATAVAPSPLGTTTFLTPFDAFDALGRETFGFEFTGFGVETAADPGPAAPLSGVASAGAGLAFRAEALDPSRTISRSVVDYLNEGATATPALTLITSVVQALGGDPGTGGPCLVLVDNLLAPGGGPRSVEFPCFPQPFDAIWPSFLTAATAIQSADPQGAGSTMAARIDRVGFQILGTPQAVVPEPSTVALLAGGLLALGAAAAGRRQRA